MRFTVTIPIKPHLKKFLSLDHELEPYVLSRGDELGMFVFQLLDRPLEWEGEGQDHSSYSANLVVVLPPFYSKWNKFELKKNCIYAFNQKYDHQFDRAMNLYLLNIRGVRDQQVKSNLKKFLAIFGITEDEFAYETAIKRHQRWLRRVSQNNSEKFFMKLSTINSFIR